MLVDPMSNKNQSYHLITNSHGRKPHVIRCPLSTGVLGEKLFMSINQCSHVTVNSCGSSFLHVFSILYFILIIIIMVSLVIITISMSVKSLAVIIMIIIMDYKPIYTCSPYRDPTNIEFFRLKLGS